MSSSLGKRFKVTLFGESHGPAVGCVMEGVPSGTEIDMEALIEFLDRRTPGKSDITSERKEKDLPVILSGVVDGISCGTPICIMIENRDARSSDYRDVFRVPRPGHGDYTSILKHGQHADLRGGGHYSGRLTAPLCAAGGVALQILEKMGVAISAEITEIGGNTADPMSEVKIARDEGDSVGGIISCRISGVPGGKGEPVFYGVEQAISSAVFGIPAVKGIEFGEGFGSARMKGSENNDAFVFRDGKVETHTNHNGGVLAGMTTGMPITFRVAFKPTPSIAKEQDSVDLSTGESVKIKVEGRHDPCVVVRAVPCVEAAAAIVILDLML